MKNTEQSRDPVSGDIYTHVESGLRVVIVAAGQVAIFDVLKFRGADYAGQDAISRCELDQYYKRTGNTDVELDKLF